MGRRQEAVENGTRQNPSNTMRQNGPNRTAAQGLSMPASSFRYASARANDENLLSICMLVGFPKTTPSRHTHTRTHAAGRSPQLVTPPARHRPDTIIILVLLLSKERNVRVWRQEHFWRQGSPLLFSWNKLEKKKKKSLTGRPLISPNLAPNNLASQLPAVFNDMSGYQYPTSALSLLPRSSRRDGPVHMWMDLNIYASTQGIANHRAHIMRNRQREQWGNPGQNLKAKNNEGNAARQNYNNTIIGVSK
jgi:hypothetical protein